MSERLEAYENLNVNSGDLDFAIGERLSSPPSQRGSATGQTCPDIFLLTNDSVGLIGEIPNAPDQVAVPALVVPESLVYDALFKLRA